MDANFNPVDIKPDLKKAVNGFGSFKVALATVLTVKIVLDLATFFEYTPVVIEELSNAASAGRLMVRYMEEGGQIEPTSIVTFLCALKKMCLSGIEMRVRKLYEEHTGRLCSSDDQSKAQLEEKQLVASSASFSTAKSPSSYKGDRNEKQLVAGSASSSTAKSPPSQKGDRTEKQLVASSASSSPVKSPPSQKGDHTDTIFISFSSWNEEEVTDLVSKIESVFGVDSCWMYTRRNLPGDYMLDSITAAIKKADIMLCMITQDYIDSEICRDEFNLAKAHKKHIIPLHLEKVKVPYQTTNGGDPGIQLEATKLVYARMYIEKPEPEFQKVIAKMKKYIPVKDANAYGKTLVTLGSPSTSGRKKRRYSQDGDASEVKVNRKE